MEPDTETEYSVGRSGALPVKRRNRSKITNGKLLDVDRRGMWARRFRDLYHAFIADCGGEEILSEGQRAIIRRIATMEVELEQTERRFAVRVATRKELETFQRVSNSQRRLIETLGIHRGRQSRNLTPDLEQYIEAKYGTNTDDAEATDE